MNGAPLPLLHGAPLRLAIPVKYGIKNIKRIGTIRFTDVRPADFWGERGYDWYAAISTGCWVLASPRLVPFKLVSMGSSEFLGSSVPRSSSAVDPRGTPRNSAHR
jgi:DMSO/TMAO reductase YedYZ molybdopterin-dependent catalytic subunit